VTCDTHQPVSGCRHRSAVASPRKRARPGPGCGVCRSSSGAAACGRQVIGLHGSLFFARLRRGFLAAITTVQTLAARPSWRSGRARRCKASACRTSGWRSWKITVLAYGLVAGAGDRAVRDFGFDRYRGV